MTSRSCLAENVTGSSSMRTSETASDAEPADDSVCLLEAMAPTLPAPTRLTGACCKPGAAWSDICGMTGSGDSCTSAEITMPCIRTGLKAACSTQVCTRATLDSSWAGTNRFEGVLELCSHGATGPCRYGPNSRPRLAGLAWLSVRGAFPLARLAWLPARGAFPPRDVRLAAPAVTGVSV